MLNSPPRLKYLGKVGRGSHLQLTLRSTVPTVLFIMNSDNGKPSPVEAKSARTKAYTLIIEYSES